MLSSKDLLTVGEVVTMPVKVVRVLVVAVLVLLCGCCIFASHAHVA